MQLFKNLSKGNASKLWRNILQNSNKRTTVWRSWEPAIYSAIVSQGYASKLVRNISKTAQKEPQLGDPENQPYILQLYPKEMPPS